MIHRRKGRKLKRTASHRSALLSNLSTSLIKNKKITTTLAKAKELRGYVDKLVTKSKKAYSNAEDKASNVHFRREVNKVIKDREAIKTLFEEIAPKVSERPGGYTRVLKLGRRLGDAAEMAIIEFVDYNIAQDTQSSDGKEKKKKPARRKTTKKAADKKETKTKAETKTKSKPRKKATKEEASAE